MKFRTGFVSNSSSASFVIAINISEPGGLQKLRKLADGVRIFSGEVSEIIRNGFDEVTDYLRGSIKELESVLAEMHDTRERSVWLENYCDGREECLELAKAENQFEIAKMQYLLKHMERERHAYDFVVVSCEHRDDELLRFLSENWMTYTILHESEPNLLLLFETREAERNRK